MLKNINIKYKDTDLSYSFGDADPSGMGCVYEIINRDEYQLDKYKNLKGKYFIDIGANNGLVTIILAKNNPESTIISVEPLKSCCDIIRKNIIDNNLNNVILYERALHGFDKQNINIYLGGRFTGSSTTCVENIDAFNKIEGVVVNESVETITFDTLIDENNINEIELLKIDCEGGEYHLYKSNKLKEGMVKNICGEFHDCEYNTKNDPKKLINYCEKYIDGEIVLTILERYYGKSIVSNYFRASIKSKLLN